jgi:predicted outer membrane repeat protein
MNEYSCGMLLSQHYQSSIEGISMNRRITHSTLLLISMLFATMVYPTVGAAFTPTGAIIPPNACFAETTGDATTDFASIDSQAVRSAVTSVAAGATIKLAGTCSGVANDRLVIIDKPLIMRGGYTNLDWATSNPATNPTILDAATAGRVIVITSSGVTLDGLTITNGRLPIGLPLDSSGGGILVASSGVFTLVNSIVSNNATSNEIFRHGGGIGITTARTIIQNSHFFGNTTRGDFSEGGAIYTFGDIEMTDSTLQTNSATNSGGAISVQGSANITVTSSLLQRNQSTGGNGGALFVTGYLTMTDTTVISNTTFAGGGGAYVLEGVQISQSLFSQNKADESIGGGLAIQNGRKESFISATTFISNTTNDDGGGLAVQGETAQIQIDECRFEANTTALKGGGVFAEANDGTLPITVTRSLFLRNSATQGGGAIFFYRGSRASADNNLIVGNTATTGAADIGLGSFGVSMGVFGGSSLPAELAGRHNTFVAATTGAGTSVMVAYTMDNEALSLTNSIFDGYSVGVARGSRPATVTLNGVLWSNVGTPTTGTPITATNAMSGDARFVSRTSGDYHLLGDSPAIDAGVTTTLSSDYDGDLRPIGTAADHGYDEYLVVPQPAFLLHLPLIVKP